ncbi:hypothetical protein FFI94_008875 [Rhodococcus sp. KBS0724]|uniref:hypothetical protein n=1 Tax=Rhodococcus sp. KBS0724 TaxID=1179674 RepID=UPI00110E7C33|nr:hypothetical protein [Rhodococcus sp. KBS0724]TSD46262.1 hypothetical protein FFI94_008875 [Rhodococcus sp. KBS0724]
MPAYVLDGAGRVDLPRRPLAVSADAGGVGVELSASTQSGQSAGAVHPRPGLMILPRIADVTTVSARPADGQIAFPQGTVLRVTIGVDSQNDLDPDRAELRPMDVSGLHRADLATITLGAESLEIAARRTEVDVALGELASLARSSARGILRTDRLRDAQCYSVSIDIDSSMSMVHRFDDSSVSTVADLLAGVSTVLGDATPTVSVLGARSTLVPECALRDLKAVVQGVLDSASMGVGFQSVPSVPAAAASRHIVYTITDSVPADFLAEASDSSSTIRHLVVLSEVVPASIPAGTYCAVISPRSVETLTSDPSELSRIISQLLFPVMSDSTTGGFS